MASVLIAAAAATLPIVIPATIGIESYSGLDLGVDFKVYHRRMNQQLCVLAVASLVLSSSIQTLAQHPSMPAGMTHEEHLAQLQKEAEMKQRSEERRVGKESRSR